MLRAEIALLCGVSLDKKLCSTLCLSIKLCNLRFGMDYNPDQKCRGYFQNSTRNTPTPPPPPPPTPCNVVMLLCLCTVRMISVAINIAWGWGLPEILTDSTTTGCGYPNPKHKCRLRTLFSYLSRKILARIVAVEGHLTKHWMEPCNGLASLSFFSPQNTMHVVAFYLSVVERKTSVISSVVVLFRNEILRLE